jgi:hypothetical protein
MVVKHSFNIQEQRLSMGTNYTCPTAKNTCSISSAIWSITNANIHRRGSSLFNTINQTVPYYGQLTSMLQLQGTRPNMPEYPEIAAHIKEAIDQIYNGTKEPELALDEAAAKSANVLGW